jgi:GDP-4-dehydro-6-deoxy-D-mannose reductase
MARLLVTGGSGFIGKRLVDRLRESHEVVAPNSTELNLTSSGALESFPSVDRVFHLGARTFVPASWSTPRAFVEANLLSTMAVLEYCRRTSTPATIVSAYTYGNIEALPIGEDQPCRPSNPYALSKHLGEIAGEFYARAYGLPLCIVRPFNIYGPGQDDRFLVPSIIRQVLDGREVIVDALTPRRDYVYVDDLVSALVLSYSRSPIGLTVLNIASGHSLSVADVIAVVQHAAGTNVPVFSRDISRPHELADVVGDPSRAQQVLGWRPATSIEEGMSRCLKFERANFGSDSDS